MKRFSIVVLLFTLLTGLTVKAQEGEKKSIFKQWPALDAYHKTMSSTFHPAEEGDLAPLKARSVELAEGAKKLLTSIPPKELSTPAINASVKLLAKESAALNKLVKQKATDAVLTKTITALHDRFHEIVGLCTKKH